MDVSILDPQTNKTYDIEWGSAIPPSEEAKSQILEKIKASEQGSFGEFMGENVPRSLRNFGEGLVVGGAQSVASVGSQLQDVMLGSTIKSLVDKTISKQPETKPANAVTEQLLKPAVKTAVGEQMQAVPEVEKMYAERYGGIENIKKSLYEDPVAVAADAMTVGSALGGLKGIIKKPSMAAESVAVKPSGKTLPVSKLIADKLEHSTVENVGTNPYVRKNVSVFASEDIDKVVNDAAEATINARNKISDAQSFIYQKHGITDEMQIPIKDAIAESDKYIKSQKPIGENKAAVIKAKELLKDIKSQIKGGRASFGSLKELTRQIYELADTYVTPEGKMTEAGRLFERIGAELTKAKKSVLPLKEASNQFTELMEAEHKLRDIMRLDRINGEQTLPLKILRRFKDAEHGQFKSVLESINNVFKKNKAIFIENPETANLINEYGNADFVDKIKLTQALHDMTTKRAITPVGVSRLPILAYILRGSKLNDPMAKMVALKKLIDSGVINPDILTKEIPLSENIFGGRTASKLRAYSSLFKKPNMQTMGIMSLIANTQNRSNQ